MKTIWLIRHAESTANVGKKTATPETIGLTDTGREQANRLADYISDEPDLIVTSPFIRTLHTAKPLLTKYPRTKHEQWPIQEFTYLSPEKCNNTTMEDRIPMAMEYWERNDPHYCDGDGAESFNSFIGRVIEFKEKLKGRPEKYIIVFSHYQFIAAFDWINGNNQNMNTTEAMAEFRQRLFSHKLDNTGILKLFIQA
jgi:broad specificity phosphatase PhoE